MKTKYKAGQKVFFIKSEEYKGATRKDICFGAIMKVRIVFGSRWRDNSEIKVSYLPKGSSFYLSDELIFESFDDAIATLSEPYREGENLLFKKPMKYE